MIRIFQAFALTIIVAFDVAYAGSLAAAGLKADVYSITIKPDMLTTGVTPEIRGYIQNKSNVNIAKALFAVRLVLTYPDKSRKVWSWNNVSLSPNQKMSFPLSKGFDINRPGTYKVEYSVNIAEKNQIISSRSKTFVVKESAGMPASADSAVTNKTKPTTKLLTPASKSKKTTSSYTSRGNSSRYYVGFGGYANAVNFSVGPSLILWPLENWAIQGNYGVGAFTTYEARGFYSFNISTKIKPYFGAGYVHVAKEFNETVSGTTLKGTIGGSSYSFFGGVEVPLISDRLVFYLDVSGTPLKLSTDVTVNAQTFNINANYSPVTVGAGLILNLW